MATGIANVKGLDKSKSLFTTKTAPTESGGVITLATTDIVESGFKIGDYLTYIDSDNITALYKITNISSGTATLSLIGNVGGGGGGKQLYQHNCFLTGTFITTGYTGVAQITIINDSPTEMSRDDLRDFLVENGFDGTSLYKVYNATISTNYFSGTTPTTFGICFSNGFYYSMDYNGEVLRQFSGTTFKDNVIEL